MKSARSHAPTLSTQERRYRHGLGQRGALQAQSGVANWRAHTAGVHPPWNSPWRGGVERRL
eukprot:2047960-Pleurochrysis_carterae.AAC.1